ncbi:restriction endonuclease subunit S [Agromyces allii]|uniref:Type I restriction modification DNA specificity domain-containing protein n=1 Tax=Agromyces allii TaxID=393607 RepID=A0ABN2Q5P3_9MICO|nr:restriction endonuclease subunit S [Agromyces allii]
MTTVRLDDLIKSAGSRAGNRLAPVYSVTKHRGFVRSDEYFTKQVHSKDLSTYKLVEQGDFAYATIHLDEGSIGRATERSLISPMYTVFSIDEQRVDPEYLYRFLKSPTALAQYATMGNGTAERRKSISLATLGRMSFALPPLPEQRRIAAILDEADALRGRQARSVKVHDEAADAVYRELFAKREGRVLPLSEIADVSSGITKGRKTNGAAMREVPFMAVVNVQDKRIDLTNVKRIEATATEIERYRLRAGDLLLTEGGDPDKLGRGVLWNDELPESIHQNHIFRVRLKSGDVDPLYLNWHVGSEYGKAYFLRMAKQTTGIASINSTQLKAFPAVVPSRVKQNRFVESVRRIEASKRTAERVLRELDALFASLQHRAFRGEL